MPMGLKKETPMGFASKDSTWVENKLKGGLEQVRVKDDPAIIGFQGRKRSEIIGI